MDALRDPRLPDGTGAAPEFHCSYPLPGDVGVAEQYIYDIGTYHYNWHADIEALVVLRGRVEVCAGGAVNLLDPGDVVVINSNEGHATLPTGPRATVLLLHVDPRILQEVDPHGLIPRFSCLSSVQTRDDPVFVHLRAVLAQIMLNGEDTSPAGLLAHQRDVLDVLSVLTGTFTTLDEHIPGSPTTSTRTAGLITAHVDRHFRERFTLADLADVAGYSPNYLSDLFATQVGMTISEYVTRVRLAAAVRELADDSVRIAQVATDNGFADVKSFGKAFRCAFGKPPSVYRARLRELGPAIHATDASFHKTFIHRDDAAVVTILREMAGGIDEGASIAPPRSRTLGPELEELGATAAYLADRLHLLAHAE
jgi:AraC-like DNA-binding protein/quercetin dioxygenase-like cupin family protein